jgi:hypothetical protein
MKEAVRYVNPPEVCDVCRARFGTTMYDAATRQGWGNLCESCFSLMGCSLGTGRGQKYEYRTEPQAGWYKTAG